MKISIDNIPEEGLQIVDDVDIVLSDSIAVSKAHIDVMLRKISDEVLVEGQVSTKLGLSCSRCLCEFERALDVELNLAYCHEDELDDEDGEHEVGADEINTGFFSGDELDLGEVIKEQFLLSIPMKPLCKEDCEGICSSCGADLNEKDCGCDRTSIDPRFSVLEEYRNKLNKE